MLVAPFPSNEEKRLKFLRNLRVLDTPIEERFERITRIVCRSLNVPVSAISLVDNDRQWFKSIQGLAVDSTSRDVAFCSHAILENKPFVVNDARQDPRFNCNPLVKEDPSIRFYAGCPLDMGNDIRIGTLCAIDNKPREMSKEQLAILQDLTEMVRTELQTVALTQAHLKLIDECNQAQRAALLDPLTNLWNRGGAEKLLTREWAEARRKVTPISIALLDIDHFKQVNDSYGHGVGDEVIRGVGRAMVSVLRPYDSVCRWGGEEFLLILPGCDQFDLAQAADRVIKEISEYKTKTQAGVVRVTASLGGVSIYPSCDIWTKYIDMADKALYRAKNEGRNRFVVAEDNSPSVAYAMS